MAPPRGTSQRRARKSGENIIDLLGHSALVLLTDAVLRGAARHHDPLSLAMLGLFMSGWAAAVAPVPALRQLTRLRTCISDCVDLTIAQGLCGDNNFEAVTGVKFLHQNCHVIFDGLLADF